MVLEFGTRFFRAGFPGESCPRCVLGFGPNEQRRIGDYRQWIPTCGEQSNAKARTKGWGEDYELWHMDLREVDIGLVEDRIERTVREAYTKFLLADHKPKRVMLAVPSLMPHALLSSLLTTLFSNFQAPSVTLLSSPVSCTVAAGLRSALVIDIGWRDTSVTAVYEHREIRQRKSIRATRTLTEETATLLQAEIAKAAPGAIASSKPIIDLEAVEDVLLRVGWSMSRADSQNADEALAKEQTTCTIPLPASSPAAKVQLPMSKLAGPADIALFAKGIPAQDLDDHELPLQLLAYKLLLELPIDVRKVCMARIVVTGGASQLPGLKSRLLEELRFLVKDRGWDPVSSYGSATGKRKGEHMRGRSQAAKHDMPIEVVKISEDVTQPSPDRLPTVPAALAEQERDPIAERLQYTASKGEKPYAQGFFRIVETAGAWAGASLLANLRVKGIVEIEKDKFLQHGLHGASREKDVSVVPQRQSLGPGARLAAGDRSSFTLGVWA